MPNMTHVRRFYKKVEVVEHPLSSQLERLPTDQKVSLKNLRLSHDKYYAVTLDGKVTKTLYKDDLYLPSRALAVALAEEWDS
jgi:chaperone required for assembly of F1-ATPase